MTAPKPDAELRMDEPADVYHSHTDWWGHTMFEDSRRSLERCHATHVAKTVERKIDSRTQDIFDRGNATHAATLEPAAFGDRWLRGPTDNRRTKKWTEAAEKVPEGAKMLPPSTFDAIELMAARVRCHPIVGPALERPGFAEASIYWTCPKTGLKKKCRPDWLVAPEPGRPGVIVDLKTTSKDVSPDEVARSFVNYGYHRQQAHYSEGFEALFGERIGTFVFCFVSTKPPHEVAAFCLDDTSVELGEDQRGRDASKVAEALAAGDFSQAWNTDVATLVLPSYAHFAD